MSDLGEFVKRVGDAIMQAQARMGDAAGMRIAEVTAEIAVAVSKVGDAGVEFAIVEMGGKITDGNTHTVSITFVPESRQTLSSMGDELSDAIASIEEAVLGASGLTMSSASIALQVAMTKEGGFKVFGIGAEGSHKAAHTVKLKLEAVK